MYMINTAYVYDQYGICIWSIRHMYMINTAYVYDQYGICTCTRVKSWQIHSIYSISVTSLHRILMNTINILQYPVCEYMMNTAYVPLYPAHILWIQYTYFNIQNTFYKYIVHPSISSMCSSHYNTYITHMFTSLCFNDKHVTHTSISITSIWRKQYKHLYTHTLQYLSYVYDKFVGKLVFIFLRVSANLVYKFQGKPGTTTVEHDFNPNGLKFHRGSPWVSILSWLNLKANKDYVSYENTAYASLYVHYIIIDTWYVLLYPLCVHEG